MSDPIPKYQNESEKELHFNIVKIETAEQLTDLIAQLSEVDLIFRGVHDSTYKVFSSYHRYLHLNKGDKSYVEDEGSLLTSKVISAQIEKIVCSRSFRKTFMRIADDYAEKSGGKYRLDTGHFRYLFHSLSKMQHYNEHTFLVDFTYDIYVGLLFATLDHHNSPYVSLIAYPIHNVLPVNLEDTSEDIEHYAERENVKHHLENSGLLKKKLYDVGLQQLYHPIVLFIGAEEKYLRNNRQKLQQGCFIIYTPTNSTGIMNEGLESLIADPKTNPTNPSGVKLTSYEISASLIPDIKRILKMHKVTPYSIGLSNCCASYFRG